MILSVLTPEKQVFEGEVLSVKVPGALGQFQVLKGHAPLVSSLKEGRVFITIVNGGYQLHDEASGEMQKVEEPRDINFSVKGGFIEVINDKISLLASGVDDIVQS